MNPKLPFKSYGTVNPTSSNLERSLSSNERLVKQFAKASPIKKTIEKIKYALDYDNPKYDKINKTKNKLKQEKKPAAEKAYQQLPSPNFAELAVKPVSSIISSRSVPTVKIARF